MRKKIIVISLVVISLILVAGYTGFQVYKTRFIDAECQMAIKSRLVNAQLNLTETLLSNPLIQNDLIKKKLEEAVSQLNAATFLIKDNKSRLIDIKALLQSEHYTFIKTGKINKKTIKKALDRLIKFNSTIKD